MDGQLIIAEIMHLEIELHWVELQFLRLGMLLMRIEREKQELDPEVNSEDPRVYPWKTRP